MPLSWICPEIAPHISSTRSPFLVNGNISQPQRQRHVFIWTKFLLLLVTIQIHAIGANNLALLAGTLKTFQRHACQGAELPLQCPLNTTIDILHANYGGAHPPLCPFLPGVKQTPSQNDQRGRCNYPVSVNYKIIETVISRCHRKRNCKVPVPSPSEFSKDDPCPHTNKYVEVAFKCRPDTFINKILCEGEELTLDCGQQSRIAIYTSMFGRTKHGSLLCPQPNGLPEDDCLATFATDTVMNKCHGYSVCQLRASAEIFGRPCPPEYLMYLKTVYTCVPNWILKPPSITKTLFNLPTPVIPLDSPDTESIAEKEQQQTTSSEISNYQKPSLNSTRRSLSTTDILNCTVAILSGSGRRDVGIITGWMKAIAFLNKHFEKFILYLVLGLIAGILIFITVVTLRLLRKQNQLKSNARDVGNFIGAIDDIDGDLDMVTPTPSEGGAYASPPTTSQPESSGSRYPNSGTMGRSANIRASEVRPSIRYHDVDLIPPRSLSQGNNQYLYN